MRWGGGGGGEGEGLHFHSGLMTWCGVWHSSREETMSDSGLKCSQTGRAVHEGGLYVSAVKSAGSFSCSFHKTQDCFELSFDLVPNCWFLMEHQLWIESMQYWEYALKVNCIDFFFFLKLFQVAFSGEMAAEMSVVSLRPWPVQEFDTRFNWFIRFGPTHRTSQRADAGLWSSCGCYISDEFISMFRPFWQIQCGWCNQQKLTDSICDADEMVAEGISSRWNMHIFWDGGGWCDWRVHISPAIMYCQNW